MTAELTGSVLAMPAEYRGHYQAASRGSERGAQGRWGTLSTYIS